MFYLDIRNGKAYFRGDIHADNGYFRGEVHATSGEFTGTLKAATLDGKLVGSSNASVDLSDVDYIDLGGMILDGRPGSTGITFRPGYEPVKYQFATASSGPWHDTMQTNDKYRRDSLDGGTTWGSPYQFRGTDGRNGSDANVTYDNIKTALQRAASTQSTFITADEMGAPNIYGGNIYGAKLYVDGTSKTYAHIGAPEPWHSGFYIYMDGNTNPKVALEEIADGQIIRLALGAGSSNNDTTTNRFFITKGSTGATIQCFSPSGQECGLSFRDGVITPIGTFNVPAVWAD